MKIRRKFFPGIILIVLSLTLTGLLAFSAGRIVSEFKGGEKHFDSVIQASAEIVSYVKRAEGHLMLFLALNDKEDREKFFKRYDSLSGRVSFLDKNIRNPEARVLLDKIKPRLPEFLSSGQALIKVYDGDIKRTGRFDFARHKKLVKDLNDKASAIRGLGISLSALEVRLTREAKDRAFRQIGLHQKYIILNAAGIIFAALLVCYLLSRHIFAPITRLTEAAKIIKRGKLPEPVIIKGQDELTEFAGVFNEMAVTVSRYADILEMEIENKEQLNKMLDQKVKEEVEKSREKDRLMLLQSRQAAMGEMIGNIAHQWRQPINSLGIIVQNLREAYDLGKLDRDYLDRGVKRSLDLISYMSKTIDDFRDFFRPEKEKRRFSVKDVIEKVVSFEDASFKNNNISIEVSIGNDIIAVGYPNEYSQALLNILNNAKDALLHGKKENPCVSITAYREGNTAVATVSDNAGGLAGDIIDNIFDPYFTTKEEGKGTGLGLYLSKMIIEKNMKGSLTVKNIYGGAKFTLTVPAG
jgi:signal transduction histidine kinase